MRLFHAKEELQPEPDIIGLVKRLELNAAALEALISVPGVTEHARHEGVDLPALASVNQTAYEAHSRTLRGLAAAGALEWHLRNPEVKQIAAQMAELQAETDQALSGLRAGLQAAGFRLEVPAEGGG